MLFTVSSLALVWPATWHWCRHCDAANSKDVSFNEVDVMATSLACLDATMLTRPCGLPSSKTDLLAMISLSSFITMPRASELLIECT